MLLSSVALHCGCRPGDEQVVAYVAVDRASAEPILRQFERDSGIRVRAVYDAEASKTTGLVTRLFAEAERPTCDVFWNNEIVQTLQLAESGMLQAYAPPAAGDLPAKLKDPDHRWTGVGIRCRVIVYNTKLVGEDEAPQSIFELADPKWRGKIAIANPQFGTTRTHVAALFAVLGPDAAKRFLRQLLDNDVRITDGNAMVKNLVARAHPDASPVLVGLTDTDDVFSGQAEGDPIEMVFPDQATLGTLCIPTTVCMIRGAPRPGHARRLVDYLVGAEVETMLTADDSGYRPVRSPRSSAGSADTQPKAMQVDFRELLGQLEASTQWTRAHFHR